MPSTVKLKELPTGALSGQAKLTVGKQYKVHYQVGCCFEIDTDVNGETVTVNKSRVELV